MLGICIAKLFRCRIWCGRPVKSPDKVFHGESGRHTGQPYFLDCMPMILLNVFVRKLKTETDLLIRPARFSLKFAKLPGILRNKSRVRNGWGPVSGGGDGWGPRPDDLASFNSTELQQSIRLLLDCVGARLSMMGY